MVVVSIPQNSFLQVNRQFLSRWTNRFKLYSESVTKVEWEARSESWGHALTIGLISGGNFENLVGKKFIGRCPC